MAAVTFERLRIGYHAKLLTHILGYIAESGRYSNADKGSAKSKLLAEKIALRLALKTGVEPCRKPPEGQTAGTEFARLTNVYLNQAFGLLRHLRPGDWVFSTSQEKDGIAKYYQYEHLAQVQKVLEEHPELKTALGGDYLVTADIVVAREPVSDEAINEKHRLVTNAREVARHAPLRRAVNESRILHASISCKWTIRSDRAQNTRTEALNLIRNRKGKVPLIVAVTFEPMPTRIASIAMGTGDLDCTYHGALFELSEAVEEVDPESEQDVLTVLVKGRRLRDISDLPFDLAT